MTYDQSRSADPARLSSDLINAGYTESQAVELDVRCVSRRLIYSPLVASLCYLVLTEALYLFGPWPYELREPARIIGFLMICKIFLCVGYWFGIHRATGFARTGFERWNLNELVMLGGISTVALLVPTLVFRTGGLDFGLRDAILAPGKAYVASQGARSGTPLVEYARLLVAPFTVLTLPLLVFFWHRLGLATRFVGLFAAVSTIMLFILMGTNKAIADTLIIVPVCLISAQLAGTIRLSRGAWLSIGALGALSFIGFMAFFAAGQATRPGAASFFGYFQELNLEADRSHWMVEPLPPLGQVGILGFSLYLTTGYAALELSLREPFVPCYGVGNSFFLSRQMSRLAGDNYFEECSYPARIEKRYGWDDEGLWSSAYTWFASDVTFLGTTLMIGLIGFGLAFAWIGTLRAGNPFAIVVFSLLCIVVAYLPANNQLMQTGESLGGLVGALAFWRVAEARSAGLRLKRLLVDSW